MDRRELQLTVEFELMRHASLVLSIGGERLLVDPMLSPAAARDPIPDTPRPRRNPLVDLPYDQVALSRLLEAVTAVIVTHLHFDHWDPEAATRLSSTLPVFCQPEDSDRISSAGFRVVTPVRDHARWQGLHLHRVGGQHGRGAIGRSMGPVSGFIVEAPDEPVVYIAGDTVWCPAVGEALARFQPHIVVVNAGAAQFNSAGPITMDVEDVLEVGRQMPEAQIIVVHMEAINHCLLSRVELRNAALGAGLKSRVHIPLDGERLYFG